MYHHQQMNVTEVGCLTLQEDHRELIKKALFYLQKECYTKYGKISDEKRRLISEIATALHLESKS